MTQGIRRWGNSADGPDEMLVGNYGRVGEAGGRLLAVLPETVVLRADEWRSPLVPLLLDEMDARGGRPGQPARPTAGRAGRLGRAAVGAHRAAMPRRRGWTRVATRWWRRRCG